ncbi:hypothetical protein KM043_010357 [Ampulex compressa]|nr:hypothetical protein KM043_010357 [Ampulex compressa]
MHASPINVRRLLARVNPTRSRNASNDDTEGAVFFARIFQALSRDEGLRVLDNASPGPASWTPHGGQEFREKTSRDTSRRINNGARLLPEVGREIKEEKIPRTSVRMEIRVADETTVDEHHRPHHDCQGIIVDKEASLWCHMKLRSGLEQGEYWPRTGIPVFLERLDWFPPGPLMDRLTAPGFSIVRV